MLGKVVGINMPNLDKAYQWMINTCNAPNIGYSQSYRNQKTVKGVTYYDCSSAIWYALKNAGFDVESAYRIATGYSYSGNAITTANEIDFLLALGFEEKSIRGVWRSGDILWRKGHTEMIYNGSIGKGRTMGAHTANTNLDNQVSINTTESTANSWEKLFSYNGGGAIKYGFSIYVISALCGNAWRESNINPSFNERGGSGFGIFQWSFERKTNLFTWLQNSGYERNDANGQLEYLIVENDWIKNYGEFNNLTEFLNSTSTDIAYLTECFMRCWERPGVPALEERIANANICYNYILSHAQDTTINSWISDDRYLSNDEILNNAVMLYRFFSTGGGGGTPTTPKRKMPVWMMLRRF